jgi:glycerate kinase
MLPAIPDLRGRHSPIAPAIVLLMVSGTMSNTKIRRVVGAPDSFKETLSAREVAAAIGNACWGLGVECTEVPLSDGGEGLLDVLGGANRTTVVTGPLGDPVAAPWRFAHGTAIIEMAGASGLELVGGAAGNDPLGATTTGTGELIDHALDAGARRIIVGLGGSATTDGGFGAIRAITAIARLRRVELLVACDVTTRFLDAATVFGPQKGATEAQVEMLRRRLTRLSQMFSTEFGVDVEEFPGGGAAGGLGGALAALGGRLLSGFDLVADEVDLIDHLGGADLLVTGEGRLDATSFEGKVVGGAAALAAEHGIPVLVVAGSTDSDVDVDESISIVSLTERFGIEMSMTEPKRCVELAVAEWLTERC